MIASVVLAAIFSVATAPAAAEENTILRFCMAAFEAAMANAGLTPPEGMGTFTCACFLQQGSQGAELTEAREACKTKAAQRFPLDS